VEALAWDPLGHRLALTLGPAPGAAGAATLVALYDTRQDPILSARFIGVASAGPAGEDGGGGAPAVLVFASGFDQGALLAVRRGRRVVALPLYYSP
jgi:hypothetical protein